jgi:hypothetical protein
MPKDRYSEEEVQRILQNAIRADTDALAESDFSVDDVRRIAGELGINESKLDLDDIEAPFSVTRRFGLVSRVNFRARTKGNAELTFERALSILHSQYRLHPNVSSRPRGREMVNILPDTRSRLSVIEDDEGIILEYFRDFGTINVGPFAVIFVLLPTILGLIVVIANIPVTTGFIAWFLTSVAVLLLSQKLSRNYLRQEEALWAKILAECRAS